MAFALLTLVLIVSLVLIALGLPGKIGGHGSEVAGEG